MFWFKTKQSALSSYKPPVKETIKANNTLPKRIETKEWTLEEAQKDYCNEILKCHNCQFSKKMGPFYRSCEVTGMESPELACKYYTPKKADE